MCRLSSLVFSISSMVLASRCLCPGWRNLFACFFRVYIWHSQTRIQKITPIFLGIGNVSKSSFYFPLGRGRVYDIWILRMRNKSLFSWLLFSWFLINKPRCDWEFSYCRSWVLSIPLLSGWPLFLLLEIELAFPHNRTLAHSWLLNVGQYK